MRALSDAYIARYRCDFVVWSVTEAAPDGERVVFVRAGDGRDDLDTAVELSPVPMGDLDRAVRHCLLRRGRHHGRPPHGRARALLGVVRVASRRRLAAHARCAAPPRGRRRASHRVALEAAHDVSPRAPLDLVRRDRREAAIGKLLCAAAPAMVAAHASLATAHASLRSELAGFRVVAPLHPSTRVCASLLDDAWDASLVWEGVSAVASLADETSTTADAGGVIRAVAALVGPYVKGRAKVVTTAGALPNVRLAPAYLAEALVMLVTARRVSVRRRRRREGRGARERGVAARGRDQRVRVGALGAEGHAPRSRRGRGRGLRARPRDALRRLLWRVLRARSDDLQGAAPRA